MKHTKQYLRGLSTRKLESELALANKDNRSYQKTITGAVACASLGDEVQTMRKAAFNMGKMANIIEVIKERSHG